MASLPSEHRLEILLPDLRRVIDLEGLDVMAGRALQGLDPDVELEIGSTLLAGELPGKAVADGAAGLIVGCGGRLSGHASGL